MKKIILIMIMALIVSTIAYAQAWVSNDWIVDGNYFYPYSLRYIVGVGTMTPQDRFTVFGGNVSILKNLTSGEGGYLFVNENIRAKQICNPTGAKCINLSASLPDGYSLDAADGLPADALRVDNEGNITAIGNIVAGGTICDSKGCIPDSTNSWQNIPGGIQYTGGKVEIGSSQNASLNITKTLLASGIASLLLLNPITSIAGSGGAIVFDTGTSSGKLQYKYLGADNGDFEFITPNSGAPKAALTIKSDGRVGVNTNNVTSTLDVNGSAVIRGEISADSVTAGGLIARGNEIDFVGGAKIITTNEDFIIRLP
ncbi:MAG: hypothetical protein KJ583_06000 [Nanoarchaeota archaeon]|nr:hypothetical protein [Nanoarchaeota archaeon]MBU1270254.1 hypothetical protein [Nanoarchaeota archaeon]MBU1604838.1 hypothetical protein [Nanoarchaeota archaeon]MBU2442492.1 hypothetical protein [Nanoarchaeota archaeon]